MVKSAAQILEQNRVVGAEKASPSLNGLSAPTAPTTRETPKLADTHLRRVWERMAAIFGAKWVSSMGPSPQTPSGALTVFGDTWARALSMFNGFEIAAGLEACLTRTDPWPPSLPEFRMMCLRVPTIAQVRRELRQEVDVFSPFTLLVYRHMDAFTFRRADSRHAETMLREAYDEAAAALLRGEKLPELGGLLDHKPDPARPASPETVARCLAEMRKALAGADHE